MYTFLTLAEDEDGDSVRFSIRSCPSQGEVYVRPPVVEHCIGRIVPSSRHTLLETVKDPVTKTQATRIRPGLRHQAFGHLAPLEMRDLGKEGLARLVAAHDDDRFGTKERCVAAVVVYGLFRLWVVGGLLHLISIPTTNT